MRAAQVAQVGRVPVSGARGPHVGDVRGNGVCQRRLGGKYVFLAPRAGRIELPLSFLGRGKRVRVETEALACSILEEVKIEDLAAPLETGSRDCHTNVPYLDVRGWASPRYPDGLTAGPYSLEEVAQTVAHPTVSGIREKGSFAA